MLIFWVELVELVPLDRRGDRGDGDGFVVHHMRYRHSVTGQCTYKYQFNRFKNNLFNIYNFFLTYQFYQSRLYLLRQESQ